MKVYRKKILYFIAVSIVIIILNINYPFFTTRNVISILNVENNHTVTIPASHYYFEVLLCVHHNISHTIYHDYKNKITYLHKYNLNGKLISKYQFKFKHRIYLTTDDAIAYDPVENIFIFSTIFHDTTQIIKYDILKEKEAVIFTGNYISSIKLIDKNNLAFVENNIFNVINLNTKKIVYFIPLVTTEPIQIGPLSHKGDKIILLEKKIIIISLTDKIIENEYPYTLKKDRNTIAWSPDDLRIVFIPDIDRWIARKIILLDMTTGLLEMGSSPVDNASTFTNIIFYDKNTFLFSTYRFYNDRKIEELFLFDFSKQKVIKTWEFEYIRKIFTIPPYIFINTIP